MQAIATARRLGARVSAYDIRDAVREANRDLINHQNAFLDAMNSAFIEFADRFDPEELQEGFDRTIDSKLFKFLTRKTVQNFAQDAVDKYDIVVGSIEHPANSLSGGNQQKLVVARWIAMNPNLLLLDDPTKGVDVHSRREIHKILRQCADDGMTVIISSSENDELLEVVTELGADYAQGFAIGRPFVLAPKFPRSANSASDTGTVQSKAG